MINRVVLAALLLAASAMCWAQAERWQQVPLGAGQSSYPFAIYANREWGSSMTDIERVVVVFHGMGRDADGYFRTMSRLVQESGAASTLVLAPNFLTAQDASRGPLQGLPLWRASRWNSGEDAVNWPWPLSSFQVIDDLLRQLLNNARFPALRHIVLAGHSAGGQLVHRYAVLNNVDGGIDGDASAVGKHMTYVVANPSSYLYLTPERPVDGGFVIPGIVACANYNYYRYGTERLVRHYAHADTSGLFARFAARDVVYLLGERDNDPDHSQLDKSCSAQMGGRHRLERGKNFIRYETYLAADRIALKRRAFEVEGVAHTQAGMFQSRCAREVILGAGAALPQNAAACRPLR